MQLLIVHDDAEVGEQLMSMLKDYTAHPCDLVESEAAALRWAREHARCGLLLAQLEGPAVDGLTLGGSLGEIFPGLQTLFFPAYPAAEQRIEIAKTKVFPEPVDGERLLKAIESATEAGSGAPDLFHVLDVLQMCCLSGRSGAVQIVKQTGSGIVYLRDGKIVHAEGAATRGTEALLEIAAWDLVEFAYDSSVRAPETISMPWDEALAQAVVPQKEEKPAEDAPPTFKEPAATGGAPPQRKRGFFGALRRS
jgi:DNA-binding response OmpR family regulator